MAEKITAQMVKTLREQTGAGMMDCKKALTESGGDMAKAEQVLASKGLKKAQKSAGRTAAEGVIKIQSNGQLSAMCEFNCETDFVARDESFNQFCDSVMQLILENKSDDVAALSELSMGNESVETTRQNLVAKIGENIQIRRINNIAIESDCCAGAYVHRNRIGVQTILKGGNEALAKDIAMHIAAMNPQYMSIEAMPQESVQAQRELLMEQEKDSKKPADIIEKIVDGKLRKSLNEICLMGQAFFKDPDQTIAKLLQTNKAELVQYVRFEVGEGIEVKKMSFADEVMAQARGE